MLIVAYVIIALIIGLIVGVVAFIALINSATGPRF